MDGDVVIADLTMSEACEAVNAPRWRERQRDEPRVVSPMRVAGVQSVFIMLQTAVGHGWVVADE